MVILSLNLEVNRLFVMTILSFSKLMTSLPHTGFSLSLVRRYALFSCGGSMKLSSNNSYGNFRMDKQRP